MRSNTMLLLHRIMDKVDFSVVPADEAQAAKPILDLFEIAVEKLEIARNNCFIVSDSVGCWPGGC